MVTSSVFIYIASWIINAWIVKKEKINEEKIHHAEPQMNSEKAQFQLLDTGYSNSSNHSF